MAGGHLFRAICRQPQQDNGHLCGHFSAGGRGIWRATTRPVCTWPPAQRTARNSRGNGFRFIFFFAFPVYFPRSVLHFSTLPPLSVSLSLQSLTLRPSFHPCFGFFTPHSVHAGAFTFDESRWNYPLHSRGQWSSSSSAGWKDGESGAQEERQ